MTPTPLPTNLTPDQLTQPSNVTTNANRVVTMFWCDRYGANKDCSGKTSSSVPVAKLSDEASVSPIMAKLATGFKTYSFIVPITSTASISKFWFEVDEKDGSKPTVYKNGDTSKGGSPGSGSGYVVDQDQVLFVPFSSHVTVIPIGLTTRGGSPVGTTSFTRRFTLVAAVRSELSPSRVYVDVTDVATKDFTAPVSTSADLTLNSTGFPPIGGYDFYTGTVEDTGVQMTIDLHAVAGGQTYTQPFMQTLVLDSAVYVAPGNVSTSTKGNSGAFAVSASATTKTVVVLGAIVSGLLLAL